MLKASLVVVRILASNAAPHNSSLGIESDFTGATLVFAMTNLQVVGLSAYVALRYITAEYAASEASEKPCSWIVTVGSLL